MCGITGIFHLENKNADQNILKEMTKAVSHRGPDGEGIFIDGNCGLGHRRLSILDPSEAGAQPMTSRDSNWVVVFNGCIYNFKELKKELAARGSTFHSTGDTEVIVEGFSVFGIEWVKRFNGMFALMAWDKQNRKLFLSRDRYGIKPLYYWNNGSTVLISSEIKAFLKHPEFSVKLNKAALNEYFTFQNLFSYRTLFDGVTMLPPANTVEIVQKRDLRIIHNSWWNFDFSHPDESMSYEDATRETTRLMQKAVGSQMISDVPLGCYLSGGMDSGSITGIASGLLPKIATFTCGFDMSGVTGIEANYDERRDAEIMAAYFKTEHYEQVINAGDLSWSLPRVVWHLEDLRVGMSYPNFYISRLASKFVKVCLQGTGGDELYGGYPWRYYRIFKSVDQSTFFENYYSFWQRLVQDEEKAQLFTQTVSAETDPSEPRKIFERVFTFNHELRYDTPEQHIQNGLYFEIKTFLPGLLLMGDKLAMAHGLEERFPFLDNDLVEFAQEVPVRHKLGSLEKMKKIDENITWKKKNYMEHDDGKSVLRSAMEKILPPSIVHRKKQGFSAPDESWYRGENAAYVRELLLGSKNLSNEFISHDFVKKKIMDHMDGKANHRLLIWSLISFEWWCRIFLNGERPAGN